MGAHLSTIYSTLEEQFTKHDGGKKGYLTLKEVMALRTQYGINPCHVGVLYQVDRNHDGRFTLDELKAFAAFAQGYARAHRSLDAAYMTAGYASLCMWRDLRMDSGRNEFVDWAMNCFTEGYELMDLECSDELYIHRKALKALHVLFDMERNLGVDYQGLLETMQDAAEEQQLLDPDNPDHDDWVPVEVLRLFTDSLADGMSSIMESFFSDEVELDEVIRNVQAGVAAAAGSAAGASRSSIGGGAMTPKPPTGPRRTSMRGGLVPKLNLNSQRQVQI